jgi:hypothetical protein
MTRDRDREIGMKKFSALAQAFLAIAAVSFVIANEKVAAGVLSRAATLPRFVDWITSLSSEHRPPGHWAGSSVSEADVIATLAMVSLLATCACVLSAALARHRCEPPTGYAGPVALAVVIGLFATRLLAWIWPLHVAD